MVLRTRGSALASIRPISSCMRERFCASSAAKGSSMSSTSGSTASARAIDTRCFMPPESWCGKRRSNPPSPTRAMLAATISLRAAAATPFISRPKPMFSSTVIQGKSA